MSLKKNTKVTLYKYKSLENFEFVADILLKQRFFAAQFFDLNDPMEGNFDHDPETKREYLEKIRYGKEKLRICSFSRLDDNLLLWAHYADSFRGICIEVEVDPEHAVEVDYSPFNVIVSNDSKDKLEELVEIILRGKNESWAYEEESRIFSRSPYIENKIKIKSILLGIRTPELMKKTIRKIAPPQVKVFETHICRSTNSIQRLKGSNPSRTTTLDNRRTDKIDE